jgi:hypothetical protein
MASERSFYTDAAGIRITDRTLVFPQHIYAPRNVSAVRVVRHRGIIWPGLMVLFVGFAILSWGALGRDWTVMLIGMAGMASGTFNLSRKRPAFGILLTTTKGPVYVLASRDKRYADTVAAAVSKAISAARE